MNVIIYTIPVLGVLGLLYTLWKSAWVQKQDPGTEQWHFYGRNTKFCPYLLSQLLFYLRFLQILLILRHLLQFHSWWVPCVQDLLDLLE